MLCNHFFPLSPGKDWHVEDLRGRRSSVPSKTIYWWHELQPPGRHRATFKNVLMHLVSSLIITILYNWHDFLIQLDVNDSLVYGKQSLLCKNVYNWVCFRTKLYLIKRILHSMPFHINIHETCFKNLKKLGYSLNTKPFEILICSFKIWSVGATCCN